MPMKPGPTAKARHRTSGPKCLPAAGYVRLVDPWCRCHRTDSLSLGAGIHPHRQGLHGPDAGDNSIVIHAPRTAETRPRPRREVWLGTVLVAVLLSCIA